MADFNLTVTTAGAALQTKCLTGQTLRFSRVSIGNGTYTGDNANATAMMSEKKSLSIAGFSVKNDIAYIKAVLPYADVTEEFQWREIGLFAVDTSTGNEVLYLYGYAGDKGDWITTGISATSKRINLAVSVSGITAAVQLVYGSGIEYTGTLPITVPVTGWVTDTDTDGAYTLHCDIADEQITDDLVPILTILPDSLNTAMDCGFASCVQTIDGALRVYANGVPKTPIMAELSLIGISPYAG